MERFCGFLFIVHQLGFPCGWKGLRSRGYILGGVAGILGGAELRSCGSFTLISPKNIFGVVFEY